MSWFAANSYCKSVGAKLVEIDSEEENAAIVGEIEKGGYKNRSMFFWIGLTDLREEGTWKLASDGANTTFLNWHNREPNNYGGNEDCAHIRSGGCPDWDHSAWADLDCSKTMVAITCGNEPEVQFSMNPLCEFKRLPVNRLETVTETDTGVNQKNRNF